MTLHYRWDRRGLFLETGQLLQIYRSKQQVFLSGTDIKLPDINNINNLWTILDKDVRKNEETNKQIFSGLEC